MNWFLDLLLRSVHFSPSGYILHSSKIWLSYYFSKLQLECSSEDVKPQFYTFHLRGWAHLRLIAIRYINHWLSWWPIINHLDFNSISLYFHRANYSHFQSFESFLSRSSLGSEAADDTFQATQISYLHYHYPPLVIYLPLGFELE